MSVGFLCSDDSRGDGLAAPTDLDHGKCTFKGCDCPCHHGNLEAGQ